MISAISGYAQKAYQKVLDQREHGSAMRVALSLFPGLGHLQEIGLNAEIIRQVALSHPTTVYDIHLPELQQPHHFNFCNIPKIIKLIDIKNKYRITESIGSLFYAAFMVHTLALYTLSISLVFVTAIGLSLSLLTFVNSVGAIIRYKRVYKRVIEELKGFDINDSQIFHRFWVPLPDDPLSIHSPLLNRLFKWY